MSRIARVEIGLFHYDVAGEFKFLRPDRDGKIRRYSVLVKLTDDEGYEGYGQAVPIPTWTYETVETVTSTLEHYLAPALIGLDPADLPRIHQTMNAIVRPAFSVGQPLCKAAIDLACYDLWGKREGVPAHELMGPAHAPGGKALSRLTISWTVAAGDMETVEKQLEEGRAKGYTNFNIKVGAPQSLEYDIELAKRVRAFQPDGFLWCDANTGYTPEEALAAVPKLADAGADVLESPLPPNQIRGYQALKKQGALPILMDEGILSPVEAKEFVELGMCDGFAMKPARNAGIWPSTQIMNLARERGLMLLGSGLTDPDLSLAASLHLFAWAGITQPCALNGPQFLVGADNQGRFLPQDGITETPTAPGLGVPMRPEMEASLRPHDAGQ